MATSTQARPRRPRSRRLLLGAVVAAAVVAAAMTVGVVRAHRHSSASGAPDHPYPAAAVAPVGRLVAAQAARATRLMSGWWSAHGSHADDHGFATWLDHTFPPPPPTSVRTGQARALLPLAGARTSAGISAAEWYDAYGADDVWKSYAQTLADQGRPAPSSNEMDDLLDFVDQTATAMKDRFAAPSPYVLVPALRAGTQPSSQGGGCVCSYPSSHAAGSAAGRTYLAFVDPHSATYAATEDQIDYSRLYVAGHVSSDIAAGALLGDMIGQYFLVTRGHEPLPTSGSG